MRIKTQRGPNDHHNRSISPENMKYQILLVVALCIVSEISGNCGCLKCSKDLQVVSPSYMPYKVLVKGGGCGEQVQQRYQQGAYIPINAQMINSQPEYFNSGCPPVYAYRYQVQAPIVPPPISSLPLVGLVARPDRLVLQKPNCPVYIDDGGCGPISSRPGCTSIFQTLGYPQPAQQLQYYQPKKNAPVIETVTDDTYQKLCDCRYGARKKRELPILRQGVNFLMGLLPMFLRFPLEHTLFRPLRDFGKGAPPKMHKYREVVGIRGRKASETFLEKLQRLNGRVRRSVVLDGDRLGLPFLRVTDVENRLGESEEEEDGDVEDESEERNPGEEYLRPLDFNHLVPHNPIFYLLNAPIRFLHHFHQLGHQISPIFKSVPHVLVNSRKYLRKFGKNLKNDVLNFASDLVGDFDDLDSHMYRYARPRRFRRSVEYEPEYSLVFGNQTEETLRTKRYILKVVDEDEVERYLREKFGGLVEAPKKKKKEESNKRRLVVEQLSPKLIIDNNGRPFVEIDGAKRPLFLNRKPEESEDKTVESREEGTREDIKDKINSIIMQAKQSQSPSVNMQPNVPRQMIKDRINQILTEIQNLINLDFDMYAKIHSDLCRLQTFKELLTNEWKRILVEDKSNDIPSKIHLLDDFKEMQILRDKAVEDIASVLSTGSNFMTKKLIKILVRLQKLQCIIYRVVEDFGERIKMGTEFDVHKEVKYVEFLTNLHFVVGRTTKDLESDLKRERDAALENEMKILEKLRHLYESENDSKKLYEEAQLLWEFKNIDNLQKDTMGEMNSKISRGQKVRKELKILFDLLMQLENCEEKQTKLLAEDHGQYEFGDHERGKESTRENEFSATHKFGKKNTKESKFHATNKHRNANVWKSHPKSTYFNRHQAFPHKTIVEDKKPIKLVSNGYTMTAYKVSDAFD